MAQEPGIEMQALVEVLPGPAYLLEENGDISFSNDPYWSGEDECVCLERFFSREQIQALWDWFQNAPPGEKKKENLYSIKRQKDLSVIQKVISIGAKERVLFLYIESEFIAAAQEKNLESFEPLDSSASDKQKDLSFQSQLMAGLVHDMKTPMNAIMGFADLILHEHMTSEQKANAEMIYKSGNYMLSLINDLLSLSRFSEEGIDIDSTSFSLERILQNVYAVGSILLSRQDSHVDLELKIPEDCRVNIMGDPVRLQQVLNNLLNNAIKFTEKGSIVLGVQQRLSPEQVYSLLEFFVQDTGIGIPPEAQREVFRPYKQAGEMIAARYGGSGLGLAISRKIVELMGGNISLESRVGRNSGTTVKVQIPFVQGEDASDDSFMVIEAESAKTIEYRRRNKTILVVEDNIMNQTLTKRVLEKGGYQVLLANEGREALNLYNSHKSISLILMDRHMPVMDGLEATQIIRDLEIINEARPLPIIMLSGSEEESEPQEVLAQHINYFIRKPFRVRELLEVVARFI